jgi:hypothetical protein
VLAVQWLLFVWALITRIVSDGPDELIPFLTGDYAKDLTFASLIGVLATNTQRLRTLTVTIVAALLFVAAVSSQQRLGPHDHAGAAAERPVVDAPMGVVRKVAQLPQTHLHLCRLEGAARHPLHQMRPEEVGKQRDDVEAHGTWHAAARGQNL